MHNFVYLGGDYFKEIHHETQRATPDQPPPATKYLSNTAIIFPEFSFCVLLLFLFFFRVKWVTGIALYKLQWLKHALIPRNRIDDENLERVFFNWFWLFRWFELADVFSGVTYYRRPDIRPNLFNLITFNDHTAAQEYNQENLRILLGMLFQETMIFYLFWSKLFKLFGDTIWNILKGRNHLYQLKIKSFYHLVQTSNSQICLSKDMDLLFGLDHPVNMKEDECYLFFSHIRFIIDTHPQLIKLHYHRN